MTPGLQQQLADYLTLRRALGYRLERAEKLLGQFLNYLQDAGISTVTVSAAVDWARLPAGSGDSNWWPQRLSTVRGFAGYLHTIDPVHEVPAADLLPQQQQRATPYLYSTDDIAALIAATSTLSTPLRRSVFATLIGLLAVTGMRVGEVIALDRGDVDLTGGHLLIRHGKFDKARELHLHRSTIEALQRYLPIRDRAVGQRATPALLVSNAGTRLIYCNVHHTFAQLTQLAGLAPRSAACRPRIHDLRHSFSVTSMIDAYAAGEDGQTRLTLLSTWLGHVNPASTYWYLSASPELIAQAGRRLETYLAARS